MKYIFLLLLLTSSAHATGLDILVDGVTKPVLIDTSTPANTRAYPYAYYGALGTKVELALNSDLLLMSAKLPASLGINNAAGSLSIVLASDGVLPLPTGASTEATLAALSAKFGSLGQALMAASAPVVIASNQSAIPVSQSGTWNIGNISGAVTLPNGASTSALQVSGNGVLVTMNTSLNSINTKTPALGQATMSASVPVVISSDQSAIPASQSGTWNINNVSGTVSLPTGAATSVLQTSGNTTLGDISSYLLSINAKTPSLGAAATAASSPVTIASDQVVNVKPTVATAVTVKQAAITVGTSAVRLTTDAAAPSATRQRLNFMLDPSATTTLGCYVGSSGVTVSGATRGLLVFPGASQEYINDANDYYIICDAASQTIYVLEAE